MMKCQFCDFETRNKIALANHWDNVHKTAPVEADKEPSTYMDAMNIILRHVHGAWPNVDERRQMAREIEALVDKAVWSELEELDKISHQSEAGYCIVTDKIRNRLNQLNGAKDEPQ